MNYIQATNRNPCVFYCLEEVLEADNPERYKANEGLYRKRQEIIEPIFGTIKRKWGFSYTDLRGLKKVN